MAPPHQLSGIFCWGILLCLLPGKMIRAGISEDRASYIAAGSIKETAIEPKDLSWKFYRLMSNIVYEDPDLTAALVLKTADFIVADERDPEGGWFKPIGDGRTNIEVLLRHYEKNTESLENIGVMIRTYRNDQQGKIPFSGSLHHQSQFTILSHFLSLGGNYHTARAMDEMLTDLRAVCGEGRAEFLAPYFLDFAHVIRPAQRNALAKWALEKESDPDLTVSGIGSGIHLGLALFERAERARIASPSLLRGRELDDRLLAIIDDNTLSPAWRAGMAALIGRQFREDVADDLRIACGRILTQVLEDRIPLSGYGFSYAIATFLRGNNSDEAWKEVGRNLLAAWEKRTEKSGPKQNSSLQPGRDWIIPIMELTCRVGSKTQVINHYTNYRYGDLVYPGLWINLIESGYHDLASQLYQKQAPLIAYRSDHYKLDTTFDTPLANAIPAYLKTIPDKTERAFAELLLSAVIDPKVPKSDSHGSTLQGRFDAYAAKYPEMPKWKTKQTIRAYEILSLSHRNPKLTRWLENSQVGLEKRVQQEEPEVSPYWAARIEMHAAVEELENGSSFPIQMMWGRSVFEENRTLQRHRNDLAEAILDLIDGRLRVGCENRDTERLKRLLPFSRQILATVPETVYRPDVHRFSIRVLAAHSICNEMPTWTQWWNNLERVQERSLVSLLQTSLGLISSLERLFNPTDTPPTAAFSTNPVRRRIFRDIFETQWVNQSYAGFSILATATARRLLTESDIFEIAREIAVKAPRQGSAWREYLGALSDQGQTSEALRVIDEQISLNEEPNLTALLKVEKMHLLEVLDQVDQARELETQLSFEKLNLPREYKAIVRHLKKR